MSNEKAQRLYRIVHAEIPEQWEHIVPRPRIVQEVSDTSYLSDDVPSGTEIVLGGVNLGDCVFFHLMALANRTPVVDGRVAILLSQSTTLAWDPGRDIYGQCSQEEFEQVTDLIRRKTGVTIALAD
jgi:hypothetical protein